MKSGAFDYVTKPVNVEELDGLRAPGHADRATRAREQAAAAGHRTAVRGGAVHRSSAVAAKITDTVNKIAPLEGTVLLTGESGVGKGLVARMLHNASPRADRPFVTVSCTSLPRELVEAELFGHEKGAFTGRA